MEETLLWKWEGNRNNHCPCFRLEPVPGVLSRGGHLVTVGFTAGKRIDFPCENRDGAQGPASLCDGEQVGGSWPADLPRRSRERPHLQLSHLLRGS